MIFHHSLVRLITVAVKGVRQTPRQFLYLKSTLIVPICMNRMAVTLRYHLEHDIKQELPVSFSEIYAYATTEIR
jgi:hypothetical protein